MLKIWNHIGINIVRRGFLIPSSARIVIQTKSKSKIENKVPSRDFILLLEISKWKASEFPFPS